MREPSCATRDGGVAGGVAGLTIAANGFWGALSQPRSARRHPAPAKSLRDWGPSRHYMSTIEEPHKVGNGGRFVFVGFHTSGFEGVDDLLAASTGPSTAASPALTDNGRIVGEIGC